jgi:PAS domain S-box-containing protein
LFSSKPVNILLVDDREDNLLALNAVLRSQEYRLVSATSGTEALAYLEKDDFAVILLDVQMPGMDGLETARRIRGMERSINTPIILVTGMFPDEAHIRLGYEVGAVDFVPKPFDPRIMKCKVAVFAELFRKNEMIREQEKQKAADEELRRSRDQLKVIFDRVADGIIVHNLDRKAVYANDRGARVVGFDTAEALIGQEVTATIGTRFGVFDEQGQAIPIQDLTSRRALRGDHPEPEAVLRIRNHTTGLDRWYVVSSRPVMDDAGKPYLAVTIFRDVTEEKRKKEGERFLADATAVLASSLDYRATIEKVASLAVKRIVDWCKIQLMDEAGRTQAVAVEGVEPDRSAPGPVVVPIRARDSDQGTIQLFSKGREHDAVDLALAQELGRRVGMAVENAMLYQDVQAQRERLQKAVQARDEFISIASHELKTPVTSLILHSEMAELQLNREAPAEEVRDRIRKYVRISASQIERLSRLIEEMLDVSRIGSGKLAMELEPVDLSRLVRGVLADFSEQIRETGAEAGFDAVGEIMVRCDRYRVEQVVTNLLTNAMKYGDGKSIQVGLRTAGGRAILTVRDFGIGISREDHARIFQRFERAVPASTVSGLGLGLYIVKQIIEAHGGQVGVESEPGNGATFTVSLPIL